MAFVATYVKTIRQKNMRPVEVHHYTKLTGDATGTVAASKLSQVFTIDLASGASGAAARTAGSGKSFDLSGMGPETSGVIFLEGNDL
jgi:hypothetical protein